VAGATAEKDKTVVAFVTASFQIGAGQQRGAGAHHGVRRFGAAVLLGLVRGLRLVGFVVVDPVSSVVPVSL
jgi:hypothetical protein